MESTASEISVLLVGSTFRAEFRQARAVLEATSCVVPAIDVATAVGMLESGRAVPDVIVVAQAYPGQFSAESIERLRRRAPVAPVVGLFGSWCEGEVRSGDPWPGAVRVYWHQWPQRCRQELDRLRRGFASSWTLPPTAGDEEHLLASTMAPAFERLKERSSARILIRSHDFQMHAWLAEACRAGRWHAEWLRPGEAAAGEDLAAVIFDFSDRLDAELIELRRLAATLTGVPVIAVMAFPRIEDHDQSLAAGATAVLSKPLLVNDLHSAISPA